MKLVVAFAALVLAACASSSSPPAARTVLVVDRQFDREKQPGAPSMELTAANYKDVPPADRWTVALDGPRVVLVSIGDGKRVSGSETSNAGGERRFELTEGVFAGGRFVLRGDEAELTIFGSGVPVVSSERGKLVTR